MRPYFVALLSLLLLASCQGGLPGASAPPAAPTVDAPVTPVPSATTTPSRTPYPTWTPSPTYTITWTPSPTRTPTITPSATSTFTPTPTITPTPTQTATQTPVPSPTDDPALGALSGLGLQATVVQAVFVSPPAPPTSPPVVPTTPPIVVPTTAPVAPGALPLLITLPPLGPTPVPPPLLCATPPGGSFGQIYRQDAVIANQLGCPVAGETMVVSSIQVFERGMMIYLMEASPRIYALGGESARFGRYDDTWRAGVDPERGGEPAPAGLVEPIRGLGKVWREHPDVRQALGWARGPESGNNSRVLAFERGRMVYLPQRNETVVMVDDPGGVAGTWRLYAGGA